MNRILVIDDDRSFLRMMKSFLETSGYSVFTMESPNKERLFHELANISLVLLDVKIPGSSGFTIIDLVNKNFPYIPVVMVSGESDLSTAVEFMKLGAKDFIEKPVDPDKLLSTLNRLLEHGKLLKENESLKQMLKAKYSMIGKSPSFNMLLNEIENASRINAKVLINGETGTGKELVAWAIHSNSPLNGGPYIKVNCAAIPETLIESELFGHTKGAFTGAADDKKGKFEQAHNGTIFLDEIGELKLEIQAKLLRVLEENEIQPIGSNKTIKTNFRVLAATNKNLEQMVASGQFREDLYHRLDVIRIFVPPLRERKEDIIPLTYHFIKIFTNEYNKTIFDITSEVRDYILQESWPGNIRQLKNFIEKLVVNSNNTKIEMLDVYQIINRDTHHSIANLSGNLSRLGLLQTLDLIEKDLIINALKRNKHKRQETADELGIDRSHLFKKMKKYEIE